VTRLLQRLRQHPLYGRLDRARRLAELPYAYLDGDTLVEGKIDLLFQEDDGWRLIDFKTDRVADLEAFPLLAEYEEQVRGYARAVYRLAGITARCTICWLNFRGAILEHPVTGLPETAGDHYDPVSAA
jgi:ATP-dependent helicase/nuclease subunit A